MKLLTEAEARASPYAQVQAAGYRATGVGIFTALVTLGAALALTYHEWCPVLLPSHHDHGFPAYFVGGFLFILGLVLYSNLRATLRPSAWLVRAAAGQLDIKFRSYLHWRWPAHDKIVLRLDRRELESLAIHEETIVTEDSDGKSTKKVQHLLLFLRDPLPEDIVAAIADENSRMHGGFIKGRHEARPLLVGEGHRTLRLTWRDTTARATPALGSFLHGLGPGWPQRDLPNDYRFIAAARPFRAEDQAEVAALAQSGEKIAAIRRLRELRGYSLKEAKQRIEQGDYT